MALISRSSLPTPETHGETGSVHPKQSQKAVLQHIKQKNLHFSIAFWHCFGWTDPVSPRVSGVGNWAHMGLISKGQRVHPFPKGSGYSLVPKCSYLGGLKEFIGHTRPISQRLRKSTGLTNSQIVHWPQRLTAGFTRPLS